MKIKLNKGLCVPRVALHGEDALLLETRVAYAARESKFAASQVRRALPELLASGADRMALNKIATALNAAEEAHEAAQWAVDYLRDEINPHRAAIKAVLEAETTEAFDAGAKPAKPVSIRGKRGRK